MVKLCFVYVMCVLVVEYGFAGVVSNNNIENSASVFALTKRSRRYLDSKYYHENQRHTYHRSTGPPRHQQDQVDYISGRHDEHEPNCIYNEHESPKSMDRTSRVTNGQFDDRNRGQHPGNEFEQEPMRSLGLRESHRDFDQRQDNHRNPTHHQADYNQHPSYEPFYEYHSAPKKRSIQHHNSIQHHTQGNPPPHQGDHNNHRPMNPPPEQHHPEHNRQGNQHHKGDQHHVHEHHAIPPHHHVDSNHHHHSTNRPPYQHHSDHSGHSHQTDNQHPNRRGSDRTLGTEGSQGQHSGGVPVHQHQHDHHETRHRQEKKGENNYLSDNSQKLDKTTSNHLNSNNTHQHESSLESAVNDKVKKQIPTGQVEDADFRLGTKVLESQNHTKSGPKSPATHSTTPLTLGKSQSHGTNGSSLEHTTVSSTSNHTTGKTNPPHPHITGLRVVEAPLRACDEGFTKDFAGNCRAVYKTEQ